MTKSPVAVRSAETLPDLAARQIVLRLLPVACAACCVVSCMCAPGRRSSHDCDRCRTGATRLQERRDREAERMQVLLQAEQQQLKLLTDQRQHPPDPPKP